MFLAKIKLFILTSIVVLLTGCVMYPTQYTYYKPHSEQGYAAPANGGYMADDALRRSLSDGVYFISSVYSSDKNLDVHIDFWGSEAVQNVIFNVNAVRVKDNKTGASLKMVKSNMKKYGSSNTGYILTFSPESTSVTVQFAPGTLMINHKPIELKPIVFDKVSKKVMYYTSIN